MYVNKVQLTVSSEWHLFIGKWKSLPTQETSEIDYQTSEKWNVYTYRNECERCNWIWWRFGSEIDIDVEGVYAIISLVQKGRHHLYKAYFRRLFDFWTSKWILIEYREVLKVSFLETDCISENWLLPNILIWCWFINGETFVGERLFIVIFVFWVICKCVNQTHLFIELCKHVQSIIALVRNLNCGLSEVISFNKL